MKFHEGLRVKHKIWGPGIVLQSDPLQVEFYREPIIKTFYGNTQGQLIPDSLYQMDKFNLSDRVMHNTYGKGIIVQKDNTTGDTFVLFNSVQDNVFFRQFKLNDPSLRKEEK